MQTSKRKIQKQKKKEKCLKIEKITEEECPICHNDFKKICELKCEHQFCFSCLDQCLQINHECPICKIEIDSYEIFNNNQNDCKKKTVELEPQDIKVKVFGSLAYFGCMD